MGCVLPFIKLPVPILSIDDPILIPGRLITRSTTLPTARTPPTLTP
jgi:hypothetical protein